MRLVPSAAVLPALALDVISIVVFVATGRRSHDETGGLGTTLEIAAPFLIALAFAWLVMRAWTRPAAVRTGVQIWPITVGCGQLLRHTVFGRGTATSFIIVSAVVLGAFLVGWRVVARSFTIARERNVHGATG